MIVFYVSENKRILVKYDKDSGKMMYISASSSKGKWADATSSIEGMFFRHALEPVSEADAGVIEQGIKDLVKE